MDNLFLDSDFIPDFSYLRSLEETDSSTTDNSRYFLNGLVHSVQILNTTIPGSLGRQVKNQNSTDCTLDSLSISHLPAIDNLACENPALLSTQQTAQASLFPIKVVDPLIHCKQQAQTKMVSFKVTESRGEPVSLSIKKERVSGMDRSSQGKNTESHNRKTTLVKYTAPGQVQGVKSDFRKGKARGRTKYSLSHKSKVLQTIRNAKWNTYRKAIRNGFSEEIALKKGELAAINKRAELSSSLCPPSHQSQN